MTRALLILIATWTGLLSAASGRVVLGTVDGFTISRGDNVLFLKMYGGGQFSVIVDDTTKFIGIPTGVIFRDGGLPTGPITDIKMDGFQVKVACKESGGDPFCTAASITRVNAPTPGANGTIGQPYHTTRMTAPASSGNLPQGPQIVGKWICTGRDNDGSYKYLLDFRSDGTEYSLVLSHLAKNNTGRYRFQGDRVFGDLHQKGDLIRFTGNQMYITLGKQIQATCERAKGVFQPRPSNPSTEAQEVASQFWSRQFSRCGQFHFTRFGSNMRAADGFTFAVSATAVSNADRLNGVEWVGTTTNTARSAREYNSSLQGWAPWGTWYWNEIYRLEKRGGVWTVSGTQPGQEVDWTGSRAPDCNIVPSFSKDATQNPMYMPPPGVR